MAVTALGRVIGGRVRALRCALGLTQETLAARAGLARESLSHLERGANQASSDAMRASLCVGFGLSREELALYLDGRLSLKRAHAIADAPIPYRLNKGR